MSGNVCDLCGACGEFPDGPICPECEREIEHQIASDAARDEALRAKCTVCNREPVDVMAGEDTCEHCLRRMRYA